MTPTFFIYVKCRLFRIKILEQTRSFWALMIKFVHRTPFARKAVSADRLEQKQLEPVISKVTC